MGKVCFAELLSVVSTSRPIERPGYPEAQLVIPRERRPSPRRSSDPSDEEEPRPHGAYDKTHLRRRSKTFTTKSAGAGLMTKGEANCPPKFRQARLWTHRGGEAPGAVRALKWCSLPRYEMVETPPSRQGHDGDSYGGGRERGRDGFSDRGQHVGGQPHVVDDVVGLDAAAAQPDGDPSTRPIPASTSPRPISPARDDKHRQTAVVDRGGSPPDIFTEWWPEIGAFAADGDLESLTQFLTGRSRGFEKWEYPVAVQAATYRGGLYAVPMGLNSWAVYYNDSRPRRGRHHLTAQDPGRVRRRPAQEWIISGSRIVTWVFTPTRTGTASCSTAASSGAPNCFNSAGKYDYESCKGAESLMNWIAFEAF